MPIYEFRCPKCQQERTECLPIDGRDTLQVCNCGEYMKRIISLPQPAIVNHTVRDRVLGGLNDPREKTAHKNMDAVAAHTMKGFERNRPMQYSGF